MKKLILYCVFLILCLSLASCGKNLDNTVSDVDGNVYKSVTIGSQVWLIENLSTTKYNDQTPIQFVSDSAAWTNLTSGAYCDYDNTASYSDTYGKLYNWYAVSTNKLCPIGWHVSTDADWIALINYVGGQSIAGNKLKEKGTTHWEVTNADITDEFGFTALSGGVRFDNSSFWYALYMGAWWTSA